MCTHIGHAESGFVNICRVFLDCSPFTHYGTHNQVGGAFTMNFDLALGAAVMHDGGGSLLG